MTGEPVSGSSDRLTEKEKDELVVMGVAGFLLLGAWRAAKTWWDTEAHTWLQSHGVLLPPGEGVLNLGRLGSMDPVRICSVVLVMFIVRVVVVSMAQQVSKSRAQKEARMQPRAGAGQG